MNFRLSELSVLLYINEIVYFVIAQDTKIMSISVCSAALLSCAMPKGDERE